MLSTLNPTIRDRWTGFYRLWRMAGGRDMTRQTETGEYYPACEVGDCLRVLFNYRWIKIAEDSRKEDPLGLMKLMPKKVRRMRLEAEKRRRLSGRTAEQRFWMLMDAIYSDEE